MGKELKSALLTAEFTDIAATASFDFFSNSEDIAFLRAFIEDWFFSAEVVAAANDLRSGNAHAVRRVAQ